MTKPLTTTMNIGVDLDGVVYPFVDSLRQHVAHRRSLDPVSLPAPQTWDFAEAWGLTSAQLVEMMQDGVLNGQVLLDMEPMPGVVEGLRKLRAAGHRIHLVTDRAWLGLPGQAESRTRAWVQAHGIDFDTLTLTSDKTSVQTDVFIEDRPENFVALSAAGVDTFLMSYPFNEHVPTRAGRRVETFAAFTDTVLALSA